MHFEQGKLGLARCDSTPLAVCLFHVDSDGKELDGKPGLACLGVSVLEGTGERS